MKRRSIPRIKPVAQCFGMHVSDLYRFGSLRRLPFRETALGCNAHESNTHCRSRREVLYLACGFALDNAATARTP